MALALRRQRRHRRLAIALLLVPWCLPGVVTARMFEWLYHSAVGLMNGVVVRLGGAPVTALLRTLDAIRAFDVMFVLTGGDPAGTTETLTLYAYRSLRYGRVSVPRSAP